MEFFKKWKQLMKVLLVVFMSLTVIVPNGLAMAEGNSVTTDRDVYEVGDAIFVTATTDIDGAWVSLLKESDADNATSWYWIYPRDYYESDSRVQGRPFNIYNGVCSNREGYTIEWNLPAGDYKVVLLHGDYVKVAEKKIKISNSTAASSITADKTSYALDDAINITIVNNVLSDRPWIGIYEGTIEKDGSFPGSLAYFYAAGHSNEIINLYNYYTFTEGKDYTVALFNNYSGADCRGVVHFSVGPKANSSTLTLNKEGTCPSYEVGEPVLVTATNSHADRFVALYDYGGSGFPYDYYARFFVNDIEGPFDIAAEAKKNGITLEEGVAYRMYMVKPHYSNRNEIDTETRDGKEAIINRKFEIGHVWLEPTWTWDGCSSATAGFVCKNDKTHIETVDAVITSEPDGYEGVFTATVTGPDGKVYTDTKSGAALAENMKFMVRVSSQEGDSIGSVTATAYEDYHADVVINGELVNENNVKVEMWMQNVGSLGVDSLRYYSTSFAPSANNVPHSLNTIRPLFDELCDGTTVIAKIGEDSVKYSFEKEDGKYLVNPDSEDNARTVWHRIVNKDNLEVLTESDEDSKITIAEGSYLMIGEDRLQFEEGKGDLVIDNLGDIAALDKAIRDHVELVTEEGNTTVEAFLEKGTILKVGQSQVKLLKEVKITADLAPEALEGELAKLREPEEGNSMIQQAFAFAVKVLSEIAGEETTVEFEFGHEMIEHEKVEPTCTEDGVEAYWECSVCGKLFADEEGKTEIEEPVVLEAIGHDWDEPTYEWSEDYSEVTATRVCKNDKTHVETETVKSESRVSKPAKCDQPGETTYEADFENEAFAHQKKVVANIEPTGHDWAEPFYKWSEDYSEVTATRKCKTDGTHIETETVKTTAEVTKAATCEGKGETTYTAVFENEGFKTQTKVVENVDPIGHKYGEPEWVWTEEENGTVTAVAKFVCENDPKHVIEEKGEVTSEVSGNIVKYEAKVKGPDGKEYTGTYAAIREEVLRIFGDNRYATGMKVADFLTEVIGVEKFDKVVLTTGLNFPDALSGAYLANSLDAPILLIRGDDTAAEVQKYIKEHLNEKGEILVIGGTNAVKDEWLGDLAKSFTVTRVRGDNRYLTNIDILNKAGYKGGDILVCTGKEYADSLSGSAVDMPILLVNDALTADQKTFLGKLSGAKFHIVGGTSAVSSAVEKELAKYGEVVERFAGANRYATSTLLAEAFFENAKQAVLAYGVNFPDGLCGGVVAAKMGAPLIVTNSDTRRSFAIDYCKEAGITSGIVLGGEGLIDDSTVKLIFAMKAGSKIVVYEHE